MFPKVNDLGYGSKSQATGPVQYKRFELTNIVYQYGEVAYIDLPPNVDIAPASVFWVNNNGNLQKFNTVKQFLKIFPEYSAQIKEYIKKENINIKSREDVIKLGNYCNEILKKK